MTVRTICNHNVATIGRDADILEAAKRMRQAHRLPEQSPAPRSRSGNGSIAHIGHLSSALNAVFGTAPLPLADFLLCFALSSIVFLAVELRKWVSRRVLAPQPAV